MQADEVCESGPMPLPELRLLQEGGQCRSGRSPLEKMIVQSARMRQYTASPETVLNLLSGVEADVRVKEVRDVQEKGAVFTMTVPLAEPIQLRRVTRVHISEMAVWPKDKIPEKLEVPESVRDRIKVWSVEAPSWESAWAEQIRKYTHCRESGADCETPEQWVDWENLPNLASMAKPDPKLMEEIRSMYRPEDLAAWAAEGDRIAASVQLHDELTYCSVQEDAPCL